MEQIWTRLNHFVEHIGRILVLRAAFKNKGRKSLTIFEKRSVLDIWQGYEYTFEMPVKLQVLFKD